MNQSMTSDTSLATIEDIDEACCSFLGEIASVATVEDHGHLIEVESAGFVVVEQEEHDVELNVSELNASDTFDRMRDLLLLERMSGERIQLERGHDLSGLLDGELILRS